MGKIHPLQVVSILSCTSTAESFALSLSSLESKFMFKVKARPIAMSRVLRVNSVLRTDRQTKWLIESLARDWKTQRRCGIQFISFDSSPSPSVILAKSRELCAFCLLPRLSTIDAHPNILVMTVFKTTQARFGRGSHGQHFQSFSDSLSTQWFDLIV